LLVLLILVISLAIQIAYMPFRYEKYESKDKNKDNISCRCCLRSQQNNLVTRWMLQASV
jgi:hypothetical protein